MIRLNRSLVIGVLLLTFWCESTLAGARQRRRQQEAAEAAARLNCWNRVAAFTIPAALGVGILVYLFHNSANPKEMDSPPKVVSPTKAPTLPIRNIASEAQHFSPEYKSYLEILRKKLGEAGEQGVTDLELFPVLMADETTREIWKNLKEFKYRIVGRVIPKEDNPSMYIPAMSNPFENVIVVNLEEERFGFSDPGFALVNEFVDLNFFHQVLDLRQNPPPFEESFRDAYQRFFEGNPDLQRYIPQSDQQKSDFTMRVVLALWMEKRSYLSQYDFYDRMKGRFPGIVRVHLNDETSLTSSQKKAHLIHHFSNPPYKIPAELGTRLWDFPLPPGMEYQPPQN